LPSAAGSFGSRCGLTLGLARDYRPRRLESAPGSETPARDASLL